MSEATVSTVMPHSPEAEMSVLGAMLIDPTIVGEILEIVQEEDFFREGHRGIFRSILELDSHGRQADLVTLSDAMERDGSLERAGGQAYLIELLEVMPSAANAENYARIVRENAIRRRLASAADLIRRDALTSPDPTLEILDRAEAAVFEIGEKESASGTVMVRQVLQGTIDMIERLQENPGAITGLDTGYYRLNDLTGGLQQGELVVIAARPSMGKTTFALNLSLNCCLHEQAKVLFFSLEMGEEQIVQNLLCGCSRVDAQRLRRGQVSDRDWASLIESAEKLHSAPFMVDATPGLTPTGIRSKSRRARIKMGGLDLVIVDYLQLVAATGRVENRQQEISNISRSLKELARELDCPVIALSQLNRSVDSREDHRPRMSDLRESGAIEQDADLIMFLYREDYYASTEEGPAGEGSVTEVIVAKHRNGPTGMAKVLFFPQYLRFENLAAGREP